MIFDGGAVRRTEHVVLLAPAGTALQVPGSFNSGMTLFLPKSSLLLL
jgi:hypothetical protein